MKIFENILRLFGKTSSQKKPVVAREPLVPSPANAMSREEVHTILQHYGVADLLTPQDDPIFWATVLQHFWPMKELVEDAAQPIPPNFFFGIKEASKESPIWSHAPQTACVRLTGAPDGQLRPTSPDAAKGQNYPGYSINVSRPSVGGKSGWFENRRQFGPTFGNGKSGVCRFTPPGIWSTPMESVRYIS